MGFIWFCAAGYSFFLGIALIICAILFSVFNKKLHQKLIIYTLIIIAAFLVFLSATPLPLWLYSVWAISALVWLFLIAFKISSSRRLFVTICIVFAFLTIATFITELPYCFKPSFTNEKFEKLYIIGDSVSAGIGGQNEITWPKIFHNEFGINTIDLSESGATVSSAIRQAAQVSDENAIVLLEIGGNDLFAPTPYKQFEQSLRQILETVSSHQRKVVMLELPLLPKHVEYGRIQRRLAKQFKATLIPKRFFVSVLSVKNASPDLAHLSSLGHKLMARKLWTLIGAQLDSKDLPTLNCGDKQDLTVEVLPLTKEKSLSNWNLVIIKFTNNSSNGIKILKPLDGSLYSWHMPYYLLDVEDQNDTKLKLTPRCGVSGLWANTEWPSDYIIEIAPNSSFELEVGIHHIIPEAGQYTITFSYICIPEKAKFNNNLKYPANIWKGKATSKQVKLELKKSR